MRSSQHRDRADRRVAVAAWLCSWLAIAPSHADNRLSEPRFVTSGEGFADYWPAFSPDGKTIVFSRKFTKSPWELWTVPASGGAAHKLAPLPVAATRAAWSRTGRLIAFAGEGNGNSSLWVIQPDGAAPRELRIADLPPHVFYPSWLPGDSGMAVMNGENFSIELIDIGRSTACPITDPAKIYTGMPSLSPDGRWIVFAGQINAGQRYDQNTNCLWLLDVSTKRYRALESQPEQGRAPTWSPTGEEIAFESNRGSLLGSHYSIFIERRDGTGVRRITDGKWDGTHPVFAPDGKSLIFAAMVDQLSRTTRLATVELPR